MIPARTFSSSRNILFSLRNKRKENESRLYEIPEIPLVSLLLVRLRPFFTTETKPNRTSKKKRNHLYKKLYHFSPWRIFILASKLPWNNVRREQKFLSFSKIIELHCTYVPDGRSKSQAPSFASRPNSSINQPDLGSRHRYHAHRYSSQWRRIHQTCQSHRLSEVRLALLETGATPPPPSPQLTTPRKPRSTLRKSSSRSLNPQRTVAHRRFSIASSLQSPWLLNWRLSVFC